MNSWWWFTFALLAGLAFSYTSWALGRASSRENPPMPDVWPPPGDLYLEIKPETAEAEVGKQPPPRHRKTPDPPLESPVSPTPDGDNSGAGRG